MLQTDKEFLIRVKADIEKAVTDMRKLSGEITRTGSESKAAAAGTRGMAVSLKGLAAAAASYLSVATALKTLRMADEWNVLQQRIRAATKETGDYAQVSEELFQIAQRNGAALADTVSTFQRLSLARAELQATNAEILKVTNAVQQLGVMSGASSSALSAGLLQFAQAMSAGTVRAEELNSILENMPAVADRIAKGMGLTVGELRQAVLSGDVLSREVFDALLKQSGQISAEFSEMPTSLDRAWTTATNSLGRFLGRLDEITGVTDFISKALQGWSLMLDRAIVPETKLGNLQLRRLELLERIRYLEQQAASFRGSDTVLQGLRDAIARAREDLKKLDAELVEANATQLAASDAAAKPPPAGKPPPATGSGKADPVAAAIQALELEAATYGMTTREVTLYRLQLEGATQAQIDRARAALDSIAADEAFADAVQASAEAVAAESKAYQEFIDGQRQYLETVIASVDPTFRLGQELEDLGRLMELFPNHAEIIQEAMLDIHEQMDALGETATQTGETLNQFAIQAARNIQDAFAEGLFDLMQGNFDNMSDNFKRTLDRMVANALAAKLGEKLFGDLGSGGKAGGLIGPLFSNLFSFHQGGIVGAGGTPRTAPVLAFANAPRYHGGGVAGLAPLEEPAVLLRGEEVLTRSDPRHRDNGGGGFTQIVNISTPDIGSFNASRSQIAMEMARAAAIARRRNG